MLLSEFKQVYSNLITEFLEEYPGRRVIWRKYFTKYFTKAFLDYCLQQKNIKMLIYK